MSPSQHSRDYFGLWFALEDLFDRKVDLVETLAVTNPYFLQEIRGSKQVVYAS
jgi:predicted nucleotidyltransferase